jgi:hypothetical protein
MARARTFRLAIVLTIASLLLSLGVGCGATPEPGTNTQTPEPATDTPSPEASGRCAAPGPTKPCPTPTPAPTPTAFVPHPVTPTYELLGNRPQVLAEDTFVVTGHADEVLVATLTVKAFFQENPHPLLVQFALGELDRCPFEDLGDELLAEGSLVDLDEKVRLEMVYLPAVLESCPGLSQLRKAQYASEEAWFQDIDLEAADQWVMDLYSISPTADDFWQDEYVAEWLKENSLAGFAVKLVNRLGTACQYPVSADLVSITTGRMGFSPWTGMGSPWTGMGSPWTGMGSPWADGMVQFAATVNQAQDAFQNQWAFRQIGLAPNREGLEGHEGQGILVGIFDNYPEPRSGSHRIDWVSPPLTVAVSGYQDWIAEQGHKAIQDLDVVPQSWTEALTLLPDATPIDDHGLVVASLIHAVAPQSTIHIYRVLDENGLGDLFTLDAALHAFIGDYFENREAHPDEVKGAVINLSLGFPAPLPEWMMIAIVSGAADPELFEQAKAMYDGLPKGPASLTTLLTAAGCMDIVAVAAGGNRELMLQTPATSGSAIAVAASADTCEMACFSSLGSIMAPGGNGKECCAPPSWEGCMSKPPEECEDARYGVIGAVVPDRDDSPGYAFGAGSSFSTALVSGQAALLLEAGVPPAEISERIFGTAVEGIIDLPASLP